MKVESIMEISVIINIFLAIIVAGSLGIWVYLFFVLRRSFELSPKIYANDNLGLDEELISVIVPARNEEKYIKKSRHRYKHIDIKIWIHFLL